MEELKLLSYTKVVTAPSGRVYRLHSTEPFDVSEKNIENLQKNLRKAAWDIYYDKKLEEERKRKLAWRQQEESKQETLQKVQA